MADSEKDADRQRSPNYPSIGLGDAVDRAIALYSADKGASGTMEVIASHWGSSPKSSGFLQTVASLKKFGLLMEVEGTPRKLKLTKSAIDVVMLPDGDPRRATAIKKAAMEPKVFQELWKDFGANLPSDQNLEHHLVTTLNFLPKAAADLIKQYKKTLAFAKMSNGDKVDEGEMDGSDSGPGKPDEPFASHLFRKIFNPPGNLENNQRKAPLNPDMKQDTFNLDEGQVVLQWPSRLSATSYLDLKDWMELQLRKIARGVQSQQTITEFQLSALIATWDLSGKQVGKSVSLTEVSRQLTWPEEALRIQMRDLFTYGYLNGNSDVFAVTAFGVKAVDTYGPAKIEMNPS